MDIEGKGCLKAQVKINPKVTTVLEYGMGFKKLGECLRNLDMIKVILNIQIII